MSIETAVRRALSVLPSDRRRASSEVLLAREPRTFEGIPRMPLMFGRQVGPRQRPDRDEGYPASAGATLVTWVAVGAEEQQLAALMPPGFAVADPVLVVEAISLSNLPWLAGRGYEMLMVSVPVTYTAGAVEHLGRLELVTWEDRPEPITSGREELGWNKIYADTMTRHTGADGKTVRYLAAWGGTTFFDLEVRLTRTPAALGSWRKGPLMHYRVFPRTEHWGELEVEQVTAAPAGAPLLTMRSLQRGSGSFRFHPATFEQLPTQQHIVNRLAAIKLGEPVDAGQAKVASWDAVSGIRILSSTTPLPFTATTPLPAADPIEADS